jgi:hypothetical protein
MTKLFYCDERGDYFVEEWLAVVIVGTKALLQRRIGKKVHCATFYSGRITEVPTGSIQKLSGLRWRASASSGWVEE